MHSATDNTFAVSEDYQNENGTPIKPGIIKWIDSGADYAQTAPVIPGYHCVGHKLDGGAMQPGKRAEIANVTANHTVVFVYAEGDDPGDAFTITEDYEAESGVTLAPQTTTTVAAGDAYAKDAPAISGYHCIGYKLDGGALIANAAVEIASVQNNHAVIFVYAEGDGPDPGDDFVITERYVNRLTGAEIQPETVTTVAAGADYSKTAPRLSGYKRVGHTVDAGALSGSFTASIQNVRADHIVVFLYEPGDEDGGSDGKDCCCGHGSIDVHIKLPLCNNSEMLKELTQLVSAAKGCDCNCGCIK
ncbi:MAG: MucBP domain-containing protein [Oscillospiraceae bacterium]|nr:MucBP domain-containing protein [Oscillospiraceae bacterium]